MCSRADTPARTPDPREGANSLLACPLAQLRLRQGVGQEQHRPRIAGTPRQSDLSRNAYFEACRYTTARPLSRNVFQYMVVSRNAYLVCIYFEVQVINCRTPVPAFT